MCCRDSECLGEPRTIGHDPSRAQPSSPLERPIDVQAEPRAQSFHRSSTQLVPQSHIGYQSQIAVVESTGHRVVHICPKATFRGAVIHGLSSHVVFPVLSDPIDHSFREHFFRPEMMDKPGLGQADLFGHRIQRQGFSSTEHSNCQFKDFVLVCHTPIVPTNRMVGTSEN